MSPRVLRHWRLLNYIDLWPKAGVSSPPPLFPTPSCPSHVHGGLGRGRTDCQISDGDGELVTCLHWEWMTETPFSLLPRSKEIVGRLRPSLFQESAPS